MPLYQTISIAPETTVYLWNVTESEAELAKSIELTANSACRVDAMRSGIHRCGYLSIRHLLALAGYTDSDLYYDDLGKPHLKDEKHISITHSGVFTGIIVSNDIQVGIDIERQRQKIIPIARKFTTLEDYASITDPQALIRKLTIVWGAKESLYKIYATKGLSFLQHIDIADFEFEENTTSGEIHYAGQRSFYHIEFLEFEGYTCVYALKN